ncbi:MAG: DEAD/DEAH box helicase [Leptospira sp.]|nr:DEAD/DEAH box helicase [Leptospira sp.]
MNIFQSRESILQDYHDYVAGFLNIKDSSARDFLESKVLQGGIFWPSSLISANPSYDTGGSIDDLIAHNLLHPDTRNIFQRDGRTFKLYHHQRLAIENYVNKKNTIVTSGTGSGKSMTYFIPIVDSILRKGDFSPGIRAIIVYPMNALINSQLNEFSDLLKDSPITCKAYTGTTKMEERAAILREPPHIILTNYVMLEYLLIRKNESSAFFSSKGSSIEWVAFDELHTYRGRQGSDVAILIRKLTERIGNIPQFVGTSATMSTSKSADERKSEIAKFARKMFGSEFSQEDIIEEKLQRLFEYSDKISQDKLKESVVQVLEGKVPLDPNAFRVFPLAAWIEKEFSVFFDISIREVSRSHPISIEEGGNRLSRETGVPQEDCIRAIRETFLIGNTMEVSNGKKFFEFKLHQFFSQGGSIYSSIHPPKDRDYSVAGELISPKYKGNTKLLPLSFCRVCGAEHYVVDWDSREHIVHRREFLEDPYRDKEELEHLISGYLYPNYNNQYAINLENVPENWIKYGAKGPKLDKGYQDQLQLLYVNPEGKTSELNKTGYYPMVFQRNPLLLCCSCGEAYDRRTSEFKKLSTLSSEGRSSATTILSLSTLKALKAKEVDKSRTKILSFTDNRQDASLQAGHFNDFVRVTLIRSALLKSLEESGDEGISISEIAKKVMDRAGLNYKIYLKTNHYIIDGKEESPTDIVLKNSRNDFLNILYHRLLEDLQRGWRFTQPNLEQLDLVRMDYLYLDQIYSNLRPGILKDFIEVNQVNESDFSELIRIMLDEMRKNLAFEDDIFKEEVRNDIRNTSKKLIVDEWLLEQEKGLPSLKAYTYLSVKEDGDLKSIGVKSALGKFIKRKLTEWNGGREVAPDSYNELIDSILRILTAMTVLVEIRKRNNELYGYRVNSQCFVWKLGEGKPRRDPIRSRKVDSDIFESKELEPNVYFTNLYKKFLENHIGVFKAAEHTGQIQAEDREIREKGFREGDISALYCSPTMELGVDIRDLEVVHMRNVPPGPANYAQRSGRAGRAGQSAFIMTYCAQNVGHDQYYFTRQEEMVKGIVRTPNMDLHNKDLIKTHFHSMWLEKTGIEFQNEGVGQCLDQSDISRMPLKKEIIAKLELEDGVLVELVESANRILGSLHLAKELFTEEDIQGIFLEAPKNFDRSFDSLRDLLRTNQYLVKRAGEQISNLIRLGGIENKRKLSFWKQIEGRHRSVIMQINSNSGSKSDYYPYRYLASVGFLPGYNFPASPVVAWVPKVNQSGHSDESDSIDRPKYLALTEFGPNNLVYHNGSKFRMSRTSLSLNKEGEDNFLDSRRICKVCGFVHTPDESLHTKCLNCGNSLSGENSEEPKTLLPISVVYGEVVERINSEEEARRRMGYNTTTHFRFRMRGQEPDTHTVLGYSDVNVAIIQLQYGESTDIYTINRGWRKSQDGNIGFTLRTPSGRYMRRPEDMDDNDPNVQMEEDVFGFDIKSNIFPYVKEKANVLFIRPEGVDADDVFLKNLMYALAKGIQAVFQIEERELGMELIGQKEFRNIFFWEESEGTLGVLNQLLEDGNLLAEVATKSLEILHFAPEDGKDLEEDCVKACYQCLMSYYNQLDHRILDRFLIRNYLLELSRTKVQAIDTSTDYNSQYSRIKDSSEKLQFPHSCIFFLDSLAMEELRMPDHVQYAKAGKVAEYFYSPGTFVIATDGKSEEEMEAWEELAENHGYMLLKIPNREGINSDEEYFQRMDLFIQDNSSIFSRERK